MQNFQMNNQFNQNQGFQGNNGMNVNSSNYNGVNNENAHYFCAQDFMKMNNFQQNPNYFSGQNYTKMSQMNNINMNNMNRNNMNINNMNRNNMNINNMNMNNMNMNNMNMNNMNNMNMNNMNMNNMNMNMNNMNNMNINNMNMNNMNNMNIMNNINNMNINNMNNNIHQKKFQNKSKVDYQNNNRIINDIQFQNIIIPQMSISYKNLKAPKEVLPRGDKSITVDMPFPGEQLSNVKNIVLISSSGYRVAIKMPCNKKVCELFPIYVRKLGLGEGVLGTEIYFVYDAKHLDIHDQRLISEVFKTQEHSVITVIDQNNVIAA